MHPKGMEMVCVGLPFSGVTFLFPNHETSTLALLLAQAVWGHQPGEEWMAAKWQQGWHGCTQPMASTHQHTSVIPSLDSFPYSGN